MFQLMNIQRAYLMPWHGMAASRAYSMLSGLGDVNSAAQAALMAAGYTNVSCAPQTESSPLGTYITNLCTTGQGVTMTADNVAGMSQAQLQAQLASESAFNTATGNETNQQAINEQLAALTGNANAIAYAAMPTNTPTYAAPGAVAAPNQTPSPTQQIASQIPASTMAGSTTPVINITVPGSTSGGFSLSSLGPSTIIGGIPDVLVYAGGGLAALLLIMSMGGKR
jgi:hypothetical protein